MLLGILAAVSGIAYAVTKFLTTHRIRRLREALARAQHDLQKTQQRFEALEGTRQVERSKKNSLRQDTIKLRVFTEEHYDRLCHELPKEFQPELEKCHSISPEFDPEILRSLHELKLADRITEALDALSLMVIEFLNLDQAARSISLGEVVQLVEKAGIRFHAPDEITLVCVFDRPVDALSLVREFVHNAPADRSASIRAGLYTGIHINDEAGEINQFFSQHLQLVRQLSSRAPAGTLLMNENAYHGLEDQKDINLSDQGTLLYEFSWQKQEQGVQSTS